MLLHQLDLGEPTTFVVEAEAGATFVPATAWQPVDLSVTDSVRGRLRLVVSGELLLATVSGTTAELDLMPPRLQRLSCVVPLEESLAELRVWHFDESCVLHGQPLEIHLSDEVLVAVARTLGAAVEESEAIAWVREEFVLPWVEPGIDALAGHASRGDLESEVLNVIGASHVLDVQVAGAAGTAVRLRPRGGRSTAPRKVLVLGQVRFTTSLASSAGAAMLESTLADTGYGERWRKYDELEQQRARDAAARLGSAGFKSADLEGGVWHLRLHRGSEEFCRRVSAGTELEVVAAEDDTQVVAVIVGSVGDSSLTVYARDSLRSLPQSGHLRAALAGTATSSRRRQDALRLIDGRSAGLAELRDILDLRSTPPRRMERRLRWHSQAVREIFGAEGPTESQKRAIEIALNTPDIAVIQGPPGTGKTKVIAAIATRVVEELGEGIGDRQVVLTSHQHDAVDNLIGRTAIFGLPPRKHERAQRGLQPWMRQWREDRLTQARSLLESSRMGRLVELHESVNNTLLAYYQAPSPLADLPALLTQLLDECAGLPGEDVLDHVERVRSQVTSELRSARGRDAALVASVRSLRTTAESHLDDGPLNARRLRERLRRWAPAQDVDLEALESAAGATEASPGLIASLTALRGQLLDMLEPIDGRRSSRAVRNDVAEALTDLAADLRSRLARDDASLSAVLLELVSDLEHDPLSIERALATYAPTVAATCQAAADLRSVDYMGRKQTYDTVIVDEAARANPLDLQIPMTLARRRLVVVGDERQLPHLLDDEIADAVSSDNAEREEMQESLFGRLHRFLEQERRRGAPVRTVTLDAQFRMHPRLGDLVSRRFYEPHGQRLRSPAPAERFAHGLPAYEGVVAAWHDVPTASGRARRHGTSWARDEEARATTRLVRTLMEEAPQLTFGVITFYTAQVESILQAMVGEEMCVPAEGRRAELRPEWQFTVDQAGRSAERLRVGTVDAFQGKEFDVVVLSTVRTPGPSGDGLGHLRIPNRLCVALSRQRRLLLVVGDQSGFAEHDTVAVEVPALAELAREGVLRAAE